MLLRSINQTQIMQKNFLIKKTSNKSRPALRKRLSIQSCLNLSKNTSLSDKSYAQPMSEAEGRLRQIWQMVKSMNLDLGEEAIVRYMRKAMDKKAFKYTDTICESFKNGKGLKIIGRMEEVNFQLLNYQLEKVKADIQEFLWKKFCKDIDIIEQKIKMEDQIIRNSIELNQYQTITGSFRPLLISNPTDLVYQFQNIGAHPTKRNCSRLQQLRYQKLAQSQRNVSNLHNYVCRAKEDIKLSI